MFTRIKENKANSLILTMRVVCLNGFPPVHYVLEFFVLRKMVQRFEFRKIRIALQNFQFQIFGIGNFGQIFQFQIFCIAVENFQFQKICLVFSVWKIQSSYLNFRISIFVYTESKAPVQGNKYYLESFYIIIQSNQ